MNKTWALTRILLKNGTGGLSKSGKARSGLMRMLLPLLLLVALLPLMFAVGGLVSALYDGLRPVGQEGVVLGLGLVLASVVVFMFGIFYIITVFYFTQDVEHLLPLPLRPEQIVTAKFITVLLYEYLTQFVLLAPLFVVYGAKSGSGVLYYAYAVVVYLALPIVPLVLASIIAMAIMSFAGVAKNKDRFRMFGGIAAVLLSFGLNTFIQRTMNRAMDPERLQEWLAGGDNSLLRLATGSVPSVRLAANALLNEARFAGLAWLVLYAALSLLFYAVFAWLAGRFYFKGVAGISETSARRVRLTGSELDKRTSQQSAVAALTRKELRLLMRTPAYFLNCVLMTFLWPVLLLIPLATQPDFADRLGSARTLFETSGGSALVPSIGAALILFVSAANAITSTSISREGAGFFVSKYVPVPYGSMIAAKVAAGFIITMAGALLLLAVAFFALGLPLPFALAMVPVACAASLYACMTGIAIDLRMPKLVWENEQKAVKQNMNGLFNLLVGIATAVLLFWAANSLGLTMWSATALLFGALALADLLLYRLLKAKGAEWFGNIEA
ncbi:putative ABC transporter permease subunit [Paenibacillus sp. GYB003]|uniref:putative ABC transporter permease subunit n=1 Tax=Paenibacillus sp. GYB003 TaxID=2994392 RepID=UPI002F96E5D8